MAINFRSNTIISNLRVGPLSGGGNGGGSSIPIETTGLIGFWDIGSTSSYSGTGTTITNLVGNGYDAEMSPDENTLQYAPYVSAGESSYIDYDAQAGTSFKYPGRVRVSNFDAVDGNPVDISVFWWIKPIVGGGRSGEEFNFLQLRNIVDTSTHLVFKNRNTDMFLQTYTSGADPFFDYGQSIYDSHPNSWVNVGFTYSNGTVTSYKNGSSNGTSSSLASYGTFGTGLNRFMDFVPDAGFYHIHFANFAFYNSVLSAAQVLSNFDALKSRYGY